MDTFEKTICKLYKFYCLMKYLFFMTTYPIRIIIELFFLFIFLIRLSIKEKKFNLEHDIRTFLHSEIECAYDSGRKVKMKMLTEIYSFFFLKSCEKENFKSTFLEVSAEKREAMMNQFRIKCNVIEEYPKSLINFFIKYRNVKRIGFYNYYIKRKKDNTFHS